MENFKKRQNFEINRNESLKKDIRRMKESARQAKVWSDKVESSKRGAADKGYVGHKAAKMMKMWGLKAKKLLSHIWAPILALFAAQLLGCDYGWRGVMLVMLLYGVRGSRSGIACVMIAFYVKFLYPAPDTVKEMGNHFLIAQVELD